MHALRACIGEHVKPATLAVYSDLPQGMGEVMPKALHSLLNMARSLVLRFSEIIVSYLRLDGQHIFARNKACPKGYSATPNKHNGSLYESSARLTLYAPCPVYILHARCCNSSGLLPCRMQSAPETLPCTLFSSFSYQTPFPFPFAALCSDTLAALLEFLPALAGLGLVLLCLVCVCVHYAILPSLLN